MKKLNLRLYEKLTPEERFSAFLDALARGDLEECDRLFDTCPRETYRMTDARFMDLVQASRSLAIAFIILWLDGYRRYLVVKDAADAYLDALSFFVWGYVLGANNAWKRAGKEGVLFDMEGREPTDEELREIGLAVAVDSFPEEAAKVLSEEANELKALWQGFSNFCAGKGLDPEKVLAWWPPILEQVRNEQKLLENPAPAEDVKAALRIFATVWDRMTISS